MEKVSLIVAIYKSEKFLPKLLDSIVSQTWQNLEILLMDDGSPDNSGLICDQYASKDSRIHVVHRKNGGACEARNDGLSRATGDYILVIDGDDWLEPDYVEYLMNLIHKTGADMAMTDSIFTTRNRTQVKSDSIEIYTPEEAFCAIIYPKIPIGPWNKIYKNDLLKKNNIDFSRPWSGEGLYFSAKAAQFSNFVAVGHKKIYNYRLNNANSGLTHYNILMGINALENIKYIGDTRIIKSERTQYAVDWHIWKNYGYTLFLIVATDSIEENKQLYEECIKKLRSMLLSVIIHSELGMKMKTKMLVQGLFPVSWAKRSLNKQLKEFKLDSME
ncbi:glycosyltransferase [Streptococcus thermophilus]|uniref:glycosyltransferase family 2 protein n=1 Tax=Streptococcus thermophilus TaxID=1308 RepID=UPI0022EAE7B6|nr:glycosyltransferase [Streptococcus thermophilus]MDA3769083.1 glycosyltransferase [Streptococcus thermophilus]